MAVVVLILPTSGAGSRSENTAAAKPAVLGEFGADCRAKVRCVEWSSIFTSLHSRRAGRQADGEGDTDLVQELSLGCRSAYRQ